MPSIVLLRNELQVSLYTYQINFNFILNSTDWLSQL